MSEQPSEESKPVEIVNGKGRVRTLEEVYELVDRLVGIVKALGAITFVLLLATGGLVWQITERNRDLDHVEKDVKVIRRVADDLSDPNDDPGPSGESIVIGLERIGEMLGLMCQEPEHVEDPICVGG